VTAIDMDKLQLTVLRPDGVSQVIGVDEGTSFKRGGRGMAAITSGAGVIDGNAASGRGAGGAPGNGHGGESITFADVKVGDGVVGQGAVKGGLFVPTELGVTDAAAMAQRRRRRADSNAAATDSGAATTGPQ